MKYFSIFLISFFASKLYAQQQMQTLSPKRISIFKNGTFFVKKSGTVQVENKQFYIAPPSNVLLGSFWIYTNSDTKLKSISVQNDTVKMLKSCAGIGDYVSLNVGKIISLYSAIDKLTVVGTVLKYDTKTDFLKLKTTDSKIIITKLNGFSQLQMLDQVNDKIDIDTVQYIAKVVLDKNVNTIEASTLSLHDGIKWQPSYLLKVINDNEAELSLKATISTGNESFQNTDVDIVIGNPEMAFRNQYDPIHYNNLFKSLGISYDNNIAMQSVSNSRSQVVNTGINGSYNGIGFDNKSNGETNGEKLDDLYLYKLGNLDLEANSKLIVPIFQSKVEYEHLYILSFGTNENTKYSIVPVMHYLVIKNKSIAPFTTGAVLVIDKNDNLQSHSKLDYTPVGGEQQIKVSDAIDVSTKIEEIQIKREKQKQTEDYLFEKVTYQGKITLQNLQNKTVKVKMSKSANGKIEKASNNAKINSYVGKLYGNNETSTCFWEITLAPNQKLDLTYEGNFVSKTELD